MIERDVKTSFAVQSMILRRALAREVLLTSFAVTAVIFCIFIVVRVLGFLRQAAEGVIPVDSIFILLFLKVIAYMDVILPLMMFVAMLLVLSRWSRENELTIMEIFLSQCASILENIRLYKQRDDDHQKAINTMADIAEFKDKDTAEHINRISYYTEIIALEMGLSKTTARAWGQASRLHDVGKMGIPDNILQKPDKLSDKEFDIMRTHTVIGASILGKISRMEVARDIALNHHEHWDGSGYPKGKLGEESPLPSRIVALADVFDALINKRCYKDPWQVEEAVEYLKLNKGKHFDPKVTDAFLRLYKRGAITQLLEGNEPY